MEEWKSLILNVLSGLIAVGIVTAARTYRKKSLKDDIEFIEFEKNHLAEMKRSSVEMNRSSFRALFAVLICVALANIAPPFFTIVGGGVTYKAGQLLTLLLWGLVFGLAFKFWRRYDNLKNFKEATARMEEKLKKLKSKYDDS